MNILIIKLSAIGDVVHSLPFLETLRNQFPVARIDWVVEEDASQVLLDHPALDRVIVSRRKSWLKHLHNTGGDSFAMKEMRLFLNELRSVRYDLVIDLQGLLKSGVLVGLSKGIRKIGMSGSREGAGLFVNERAIQVDYDTHAVDRYLKVAQAIGCDVSAWEGRIPYTAADKEAVDDLLDTRGLLNKPIVAIHPMAGWPTKLWEPNRFAVLASRIQEELGRAVVFTGGKSDRPVLDRMIGMMPGIPPLNASGQTSLKKLAYLFTRCSLLITTDTGPMHVAAAMACPVVALFGPTAPWRTGPYGRGHVVIRADIGCSPCFKKRCDHMTCMKQIDVDRVFEQVEKALRH